MNVDVLVTTKDGGQFIPGLKKDNFRVMEDGVPQQVVFTEHLPAVSGPVYAPETLVVDHGKAFLSAHVISVCTRLGISIQPAQPRNPGWLN